MIYLNNFPREKALKGQEFKGNNALEKELLERGIIGKGKPTIKPITNSALEEKVLALESKITGLETDKTAAVKAKEDAETKLKARDEQFVEGESKIAPLQEDLKKALADVEKYKAMVKETIGLNKNTPPVGWEE